MGIKKHVHLSDYMDKVDMIEKHDKQANMDEPDVIGH